MQNYFLGGLDINALISPFIALFSGHERMEFSFIGDEDF